MSSSHQLSASDAFPSTNPIVNGTLDLKNCSREELLEALKGAVEYMKNKGERIVAYPFGFLRLSFADSRFQNGFVLHIWIEGIPQEEYPHAHTFDMVSRVLRGKLTNVIWDVTPDEQGTHQLERPIVGNGSSSFELFDGSYSVSETEAQTVEENGVYELQKGIFHSTRIDQKDKPVITLVQKSNINLDEEGDLSRNAVQESEMHEYQNLVPQMTQETAWEIFTTLINEL